MSKNELTTEQFDDALDRLAQNEFDDHGVRWVSLNDLAYELDVDEDDLSEWEAKHYHQSRGGLIPVYMAEINN